MAMSDCVKCWDTPCTCGHDLLGRSMEWLLNQQKIINAEIDRRHPKLTALTVELLRFGVPSSATGLTYRMTPEVMQAVQDFAKQTIHCEYGTPEVVRDNPEYTQARMSVIDSSRVCGKLKNVRLDTGTGALTAEFTTDGPFGEAVATTLTNGLARLSCRAESYTDHQRKTRDIRRLITFDVVAIRDPLDFQIPDLPVIPGWD